MTATPGRQQIPTVGDLMTDDPVTVHVDAAARGCRRAHGPAPRQRPARSSTTHGDARRRHQPDRPVRARATEYLWSDWAGLAVRHLMTQPAVTVDGRHVARRGGAADGGAPHPSAGGRRRPTARRPIGILSVTDLVHSIAGRRRDGRAGTARAGGAGSARRPARPRSSTRAASAGATPVFDVARLRRRLQRRRSCRVPARRRRRRAPERRRPRAQHHPARHGGHARLQPPRAADPGVRARRLRRLHGLRQRLPRHRDPRRSSQPESAVDERDRGVRRRRARRRARRRRRRARHFAHTTEVRATCPARRGLEPAAVRDLRRPGPLQGLRGVRRGLRTRSGYDALLMIDKVAVEADAARAPSSATPATCASSARCRRRRPSTATRRRSPT